MRERLLGPIDHAAALRELGRRRINYTPGEVVPPDWTFDEHRFHLGDEAPGPPEPGGLWETACDALRDYEFTPPELIRAVYDARAPLLGRDLLLEGRFSVLRFYFGVRITSVVDEASDTERVWGWAYQTLEQHLERGQVRYAVVKHLGGGRVEFTATSYSQPSPGLGPVLRLGWLLFGRRAQLRFYRRCGERMRHLAHAGPACLPGPARSGGLVLVPSGSRPRVLDRMTLRRHHPAR
ncbi:uncharacterized protein DUF1990 [Prauserella shujinwangii]|uniref:Uncharacterized protein DUF1990 n=1 Tax=Prauserella shujinwangii TaxID=1453103 RepID=A0A2T0LRL2_9PSEU|nr:DUF1990 family protein [Prauserella shujinwangii]PRX46139.1 uncharacterized protein DUF1990 [Prauserella shujinwangii]